MAREVSQTSSPAPPPPPTTTPKKTTRQRLNDEGVSVYEFLKLKTPEFKGKEGDDPQEFLEEIEKMTKIISCSDARIIEMVEIKMKKIAWEWFQRDMEDRLYSGNPPSWEEFKEAVMDEFISSVVR